MFVSFWVHVLCVCWGKPFVSAHSTSPLAGQVWEPQQSLLQPDRKSGISQVFKSNLGFLFLLRIPTLLQTPQKTQNNRNMYLYLSNRESLHNRFRHKVHTNCWTKAGQGVHSNPNTYFSCFLTFKLFPDSGFNYSIYPSSWKSDTNYTGFKYYGCQTFDVWS